ncbi:hypothetical protein MKEN_00936100 [Mycena kentingensis (nom. inval.)]|nr:hypothetical protein MKEN_00936100 [Mycena kentingensis (nom. inval.)]
MASASRWRSDNQPSTPTPSPRGSWRARGRGRASPPPSNARSGPAPAPTPNASTSFLVVPGRGSGRAAATPSTPPRSSRFGVSTTPTSAPSTPAGTPGRRMDLIASVSRSGGLGRDGDDLKDSGVQDEYRGYIEEKLETLRTRHPRRTNEAEEQTRNRVEAQENVLISFRKLREGIVASKRSGSFADEVYSTSLFLSVVFDSPRNISAIVPVVLAYLRTPAGAACSHPAALSLICLLQHLVASHPSQTSFHTSLDTIPRACFPSDCAERRWILELARHLRGTNYARVEQLTRKGRLPLLRLPLAQKTLHHLVDALKAKVREKVWVAIRTAYREVSCAEADAGAWLARSLFLAPALSGAEEEVEEALARLDVNVNAGAGRELDRWLEGEAAKGTVVRKEGVEGKWVLCRPR